MLSTLQSQHPDFLRLFYMLSLERSDDPGGRRGRAPGPRHRDHAVPRRDRPAAARRRAAAKAERVVAELTAFAVALSDGVFLADHLEPDATDVERMYRRLFQAADGPDPDSVGGEMNTKTAIITGASAGLGLECARALLDERPVLACRARRSATPAAAPKRSRNWASRSAAR